jgi:CheY-like chemotaxis protein
VKPAPPQEITAGIRGRRIGLCGYDDGETERISRAVGPAESLLVTVDECRFDEHTKGCDAMLIKLANITPPGIRLAARLRLPILVTGPSEAFLQGIGAAYSWPRDVMCEPWTEAELLVRLFRLLRSTASRVITARASRTRPLVLLADDDPEMTALVEETLRNGGIECRIADNGLAALRLARELVFDLILLDVEMPGMDGFQVLEAIRRTPGIQEVPVFLLTGCADPVDVIRGSRLKADDYLGKPVNPEALLSRVKQLLSSRDRTADRSQPRREAADARTDGQRTTRGIAPPLAAPPIGVESL